jgi:hypothetical protein
MPHIPRSHQELREEREARRRRIADGEEEVPLSVVEFLDAVEEPLKEQHLPPGKGNFIYTSLLGTSEDLSTAENVKAGISVPLYDSSFLLGLFEMGQKTKCDEISRICPRWRSSWSRRTSGWGWPAASRASSQPTPTG